MLSLHQHGGADPRGEGTKWAAAGSLGHHGGTRAQLRPRSTCHLCSLQSIDPGQQFTWENSNLEVNKPKNRYANVIAYDHSRVILTSIDGEPRAAVPPPPAVLLLALGQLLLQTQPRGPGVRRAVG